MPPRAWEHRLRDMLEAARAVLRFVEGLSYEQYAAANHEMTRAAVERKLEVLGEAAGDIPDDVQSRHPEIEWKKIVRFRDVLAHHYFGIDDHVIWETAQRDLPVLIGRLETMLETH